MFSEALKILDHNTELYMIEEQQKEIATLKDSLAQKDIDLKQKEAENEQLRAKLAALENSK